MSWKAFLPAFTWFIISFILLVLPGDDLPGGFFSSIPFFDKYVHFGMFSLLTFLFCLPFTKNKSSYAQWHTTAIIIAASSIAYGIAMEFVQKYVVITRSFDLVDILFDSIGSVAGWWATWYFFKWKLVQKNRPR